MVSLNFYGFSEKNNNSPLYQQKVMMKNSSTDQELEVVALWKGTIIENSTVGNYVRLSGA